MRCLLPLPLFLVACEENIWKTSPEEPSGYIFTQWREPDVSKHTPGAEYSPAGLSSPDENYKMGSDLECDEVSEERDGHLEEQSYDEEEYYDGEGVECVCEFEVERVQPTTVGGITVMARTLAYYNTDAYQAFATDEDGNDVEEEEVLKRLYPAEVAVEIPWLDEDSDGNPDIVSDTAIATHEPHNLGYERSWIGFNISQTAPDDGQKEADIVSASPIDISGTYRIFISMVTGLDDEGAQYSLGSCERLGGYTVEYVDDSGKLTGDEEDIEPLYFSIENLNLFTGEQPEVLISNDGTAEDALACVPGATDTTTFMLLDWDGDGYATAVPIAGARQHTHSEITEVSVKSWNGAANLVMGAPGSVIDLSAASDNATINSGAHWVGLTQWWSDVESDDGSGPIIEVTHACPSTLPTAEGSTAPAYPMSWTQLEDELYAVTGLKLLEYWSEVEESDWPAFLVRVQTVDAPEAPFSHALHVEAHGQGDVLSVPMNLNEAGDPVFSLRQGALSLEGSVKEVSAGLKVSLESVSMNTPLGMLSMEDVTFVLSGYAADNE